MLTAADTRRLGTRHILAEGMLPIGRPPAGTTGAESSPATQWIIMEVKMGSNSEGAMPSARATHEPSPDGLGHTVSVPIAGKRFFVEPCPVVRAIAPCVAQALWGRPLANNCTAAQRRQARNIANNIKRALEQAGLLKDEPKHPYLAAKDRADCIQLDQDFTNDPVERLVGDALSRAGYSPKHEGHPDRRGDGPTLDFELPGPIYVEVKRMHSPRIEKQMAQAEDVIAIQGIRAAEWFAQAIEARALFDAKDAEIASVRRANNDWETVCDKRCSERNEALAKVAEMQAAMAAVSNQLAELLAGATDAPEELAKCLRGDAWYGVANLVEGVPSILAEIKPFLPTPAEPDRLVEEEDPIDALVNLLAPVLTNGQGMAARERENRFRNAMGAIVARKDRP